MTAISVVIATYNRAPLLQRALARLATQQFEAGDEVIVVDNASTDATADVVVGAAASFPVPLRRLFETSPGKPAALNTGILAARGDLLALTDDDVLVADDWITAIRGVFVAPQIALVGGRVDPAWEQLPPRWLQVDDGNGYGAIASPLALLHYGERQELGSRTAVGANLIVRRAVHDAVGGISPHLGRLRGTLLCGEDHDFCGRVAAAGYRCEYRPEVRVRHWVPKERTTLRYYARWFYWSGVTEAMTESAQPTRVDRSVFLPRYLVKRLVTAPLLGLKDAAGGRLAAAVAQLMDVPFVLGKLSWRMKSRRRVAQTTNAIAQKA